MTEDNQNDLELAVWEWERLIPSVQYTEARYSAGFLQCQPEKWFPGFSVHWLPLAHSLGIDLEFAGAEPAIVAPTDAAFCIAGSVDDEPIGFFLDRSSATVVLQAVAPDSNPAGRDIVLEYLGRRLLSSIALCWSGPESSAIRFEPEMEASSMRGVGSIILKGFIDGNPVSVSVFLGKMMLKKLDGLWCRQLRSSSGHSENSKMEAHLEVAHLDVTPAMLTDYLNSGVSIDLEESLNDSLTLVVNSKPFLPAAMRNIDGNIGFAVQGPVLTDSPDPEGTVRLSIEFGKVELEESQIPELSQRGSIYDTGLSFTDKVNMVVNGEKVGEGVLRAFQGRYALSVL